MKATVTIKNNYEFRRLYAHGKSKAGRDIVVYCRRSGRPYNRVGFTVGSKVGKAVARNLVRRRLRDIYSRNEDRFSAGYDIVIVARSESAYAAYRELESQMMRLFEKLGIIKNENCEQ
ncbi:MAG: ribonuclease P protein component [Oscillospiraceae bacterium]|nr:ribonuclease P protein component [Oscillospiraceae bacterium]